MSLPLEGLRVLEFGHAVMGPCCGMLMADMGAEVIHVEPTSGDHTRRLVGFGLGYFVMYNRNKKSLAVDLKTGSGKQIIYELAPSTDIVVENFGPGTIDLLGFRYEQMKGLNDRLIYCSLKGFLNGPYAKRHAMDEVVQMMGGLAYMTGRPGDPLRAGTAVIDISGGMFGYIGILQALYERERSGKGKFVQSALFETCAFLMGHNMAYASQVDHPVPPMPARVSAWSIYKIFDTSDGDKIFVGVISDKHWERCCQAFGWQDWLGDERLATNNGRISEREWFLPEVETRLKQFTKSEIAARCDEANIPFAPIARPEDLFDDPQLNESGALMWVRMPNGKDAKLPKIPIAYEGATVTKRMDPPAIGAHTEPLLHELGYSRSQIETLFRQNIIHM